MRPNPTFRQVAPWIIATGAAFLLMVHTDTQDPAAPDYRDSEKVTYSVPHAVICEAGQTLNDAGDGCEALTLEFFEDGSWIDRSTGAHGCIPAALCND